MWKSDFGYFLSKILEENSYGVVYMAWSPDSTRLAVCGPEDGFEVWIWDVTLGRMETKVSSNFAAQIALIITYSINCWRSFLKFTSNAPAPTLECLEWTSFQKIHLLQPMNFRMGLGHHKKKCKSDFGYFPAEGWSKNCYSNSIWAQ